MNTKPNIMSNRSWLTYLKKSSPVFMLLIMIIIMTVLSDKFFRFSNFVNIIRQSAAIGIIAIGQCLVIIGGGIDLSVGSIMAFSGCIMAVGATQWQLPPVVALLLGIVSGLAVGLFNGFIITKFKLQDFIATLGTMTAIQGVALLVSDGLPISGIPMSLMYVGSEKVFSIPVSVFVFIFIAIVGYVLLNQTSFGRNIFAIGGNMEASRVSGISIHKTKVGANIFSGFCCAVAGLVMIGRLNSANALMGAEHELTSIAAVVLGGTSINGGAGSIGGTIIGVVTMGVLNNGLDLLNISAFWQKVVLGLVIIVVVTMDTWRREKLA